MARVRVFQIAYDASLLQVRAEMLKHAGFEVRSAMGNAEAQRMLGEPDGLALIVVGWSADDGTRREMVRWIKQHAPKLRVIALYNMGGHPIPEADFNSRSDSPDEWFSAVKQAAVA